MRAPQPHGGAPPPARSLQLPRARHTPLAPASCCATTTTTASPRAAPPRTTPPRRADARRHDPAALRKRLGRAARLTGRGRARRQPKGARCRAVANSCTAAVARSVPADQSPRRRDARRWRSGVRPSQPRCRQGRAQHQANRTTPRGAAALQGVDRRVTPGARRAAAGAIPGAPDAGVPRRLTRPRSASGALAASAARRRHAAAAASLGPAPAAACGLGQRRDGAGAGQSGGAGGKGQPTKGSSVKGRT